uniref:Putative capsid protein n=1 Tax=viral metagenome TaxID=1070528 RepID=A0A6H1ZXI4_9ZZZZ
MQGATSYIANQIFRPHVMRGIYDVVQPMYPGSLLLQESFFPYREYESDEMIKYFRHHPWGKTPPTTLGSDPMMVGIPSGFYKEYEFGYWGEASRFDSKDLLRVKNPEQPYKADGVTPNLWGAEMMTMAMRNQKHRFETLKEAFCGALLSAGNFHYFADGIDNYYPGPSSTDYILPAHYRLSCAAAGTVTYGGWTTGGTWATKASAKPVFDLNQMLLYASKILGLQVTEIWMSRTAAQHLIDADETASWVEKNPELSRSMLTVESGLTALNKIVGNNISFKIDDRTYPERMIIVTPTAASTSTTVTVDNDAPLEAVTTPTLMFQKADGRERLVTATNVSSNVITFTASDLDISMDVGDFIIYNKRFMKNENVVIFKTMRSDLQEFVSLPCQTAPEDGLTSGVHLYSQEFVKKPNWYVVAGTFFRGGPAVYNQGGWLTLTVY